MGLLNKFRLEGKKKGFEEEVVSNLSALFNTKEGFGAWQRGLGLTSYSNVNSYGAVIQNIIKDIETNIVYFEKRMKVLQVELVDSTTPLSLKFQIKCEMGGKFHSFYVGFKSDLKPILVEEEESEFD